MGLSNDYAEGYLYPYTNQNTQPFQCENQASLAWAIYEYIPAKSECAIKFISMLYQCYNIDTARDVVFSEYYLWCEDNFQTCQAESPTDALTVYGDYATKLRGVYSGNRFDDIDMIPVEDVLLEIEY